MIYALIFAPLAVAALTHDRISDIRVRHAVGALCFLLPTILAGFRHGVGTDFFNYVDIFQGLLIFSGKVYEPGFTLFIYATRTIDPTGRLAFVLSSLAISWGYWVFCGRFAQNRLYAWAIFYGVSVYFLASLNLVKAHMAISFGLIAIASAADRKWLTAVAFTLIALSFHYVAAGVAAIALLPFLPSRLQRPYILLMIGGATVLALGLIYALPMCQRFAYFVAGHTSNNSPVKAFLFCVGAGVFMLAYIRKNGFNNQIVLMALLYFAFVAFWAMSGTSNFFLRVSAVVAPFGIAAFATIPFERYRLPTMTLVLAGILALLTFTVSRDAQLSPYEASWTLPLNQALEAPSQPTSGGAQRHTEAPATEVMDREFLANSVTGFWSFCS